MTWAHFSSFRSLPLFLHGSWNVRCSLLVTAIISEVASTLEGICRCLYADWDCCSWLSWFSKAVERSSSCFSISASSAAKAEAWNCSYCFSRSRSQAKEAQFKFTSNNIFSLGDDKRALLPNYLIDIFIFVINAFPAVLLLRLINLFLLLVFNSIRWKTPAIGTAEGNRRSVYDWPQVVYYVFYYFPNFSPGRFYSHKFPCIYFHCKYIVLTGVPCLFYVFV